MLNLKPQFLSEGAEHSGLIAHVAIGDVVDPSLGEMFDYQSDRHCAKTVGIAQWWGYQFDYQSDRHCAKTIHGDAPVDVKFDYQSDRHCAKTVQ